MKSIPVEGRTVTAKELIKMAKSEPVVLTQRGQAVCAVVEVDDLDLEAWSLGNNPQFLALLERSRERLRKEGGIPLEEVRRRLGLNGKRRSRRPAKK
jgi:hypothetical protein